MLTTLVTTRTEAAKAGHAVFNNGPHVLVALDQEATTISVKTPDGKLVTFAFTERCDGDGHQCVDICHHTSGKTSRQGNPVQQATFLGEGPTNAVARYTDDGTALDEPVVVKTKPQPTTIVALSLTEHEPACINCGDDGCDYCEDIIEEKTGSSNKSTPW